MSSGVESVPTDANLVEAAQLMRASGVGGLPVRGPGGESCAGIVTERDVVVRTLAEGRDPRSVFVRDIASMDPFTCEADEDTADVLARMREHEVQHMPVLEGDEVVGMLSLADLNFGRPDSERGGLPLPENG